MHSMTASIENRQSDGLNSSIPTKIAPIVLIVLTATMIGTCCGILVAEGNALPLIKQTIASQLETISSFLNISANVADAKLEAPEVILTGYPPVSAIYLSKDLSSTSIAFETEAMDIIRTEKLRNPDRIYFDLKNRVRESRVKELKAQKAIGIAGDLLGGVRISQRSSGVTRIVLDLNHGCDYTYQISQGAGSRLRIKIMPHPNSVSISK
jgi:hypothetical protein